VRTPTVVAGWGWHRRQQLTDDCCFTCVPAITRTTGKNQKVPIELVNTRCPQQIIRFYQNHLKWT